MTTLLLIFKLALWAFSAAGWCLLLTRKGGLRPELAPIVAFSGMGVAMVAAGLLNIFTPVEWALYLAGLGLAAWFLLREREALRPWFSFRVLILGLACLWLLWLSRGGLIWGHDNMAHWAIVAKTIITENHLPNTANLAVEFTGYPVGTACFIKYFCDFVGVSDGLMMLGQGLLILSGLFSLTVFLPRRSWPGAIAFLAFAVFALTADVPLNDLRVDTILAVQGLAGLSVIAFYGPTDQRRALMYGLVPLAFLAQIKNSGLFFIALDLAVLLYFALRARAGGKAVLKGAALSLAVTLGGYWLWLRHVALVFPQGETSKHAVSLTEYSAIFGEKTAEEIGQFNRLFLAHLTDFSQPDIRIAIGLAVLLAACLVYILLSRQGGARKALLLGAGCLGTEGLYLVCLWCTYTLSMNTSEMLALASIQRYHTTTLIWLAGAALVLVLGFLGQENRKKDWFWGLAAALAVVWMFLPGRENLPTLYSRAPYHITDTQGPVLELKEQYGLTEGSRYLFYTRGGGVDTWTLRYIARYVLNTDTLDFWEYEDQEYTWNELYNSYDYIILYSPDEYIEDFFRQQGFDPAQGYAHLVIEG